MKHCVLDDVSMETIVDTIKNQGVERLLEIGEDEKTMFTPDENKAFYYHVTTTFSATRQGNAYVPGFYVRTPRSHPARGCFEGEGWVKGSFLTHLYFLRDGKDL